MKISEFRIFRYGPLGDTGTLKMGNFTILWGKNEKGKTLIVDALLKMLIERNYNLFSRINRISERPEGYVIVNYKGTYYKLPEEGYLTDDISADDFRNIFVIRDSDLTIVDEDDYYTDVTGRLTGSRTREINNIMEELSKLGKITDTGRFRNRAIDYYLKDRIDDARYLLSKIPNLIEDLQESDFENIEVELMLKRKELESVKNKLEQLNIASKREKYAKGSNLLNNLHTMLSQWKEYEIYDSEDADRWVQLERDLGNKKKDLENKENELKEKQDNYEELLKEKEDIDKELKEVDKKKSLADKLKELIDKKNELEKQQMIKCKDNIKRLEDKLEARKKEKAKLDNAWHYITVNNIRGRIQNLKSATQTLEKSTALKKLFSMLMIFTFIIGAVSILGGAVFNILWLLIIGVVFGVVGVGFGILQHRMIVTEKMEDSWESLIKTLSPLFEGIELKPDNLEYNIEALEKSRNDMEVDVRALQREYENEMKNCEELKRSIYDIDVEIKKLVGELDFEFKEDMNLYLGDISNIYKEYDALYGAQNELSGKIGEIGKHIESLQKNIEKMKEDIEKLENDIEELKKKYGLETYEELKEKIETKARIEGEITKIRESLRTLFDYKDDELDKEIEAWENSLRELEEFKDKALDVKYDESLQQKLSNEYKRLNEEIEDLESRIEEYEEEFSDIVGRARDALVCDDPEAILSPLEPDEEIVCRGIRDLERIYELLNTFISNNEKRREYIMIARKIFEEMRREEERKIKQLFGEDSSVIKYFRRITGGLYVDVTYDSDAQIIKVKRNDGLELSVNQLSGGAWDQLYFAIRLSLAERILDEKGFFILDDPFIKADPDRLKELFEILKDLSQEGWQIIYLSSKGEVKELAEGEFRGVINYVSVDLL